MGTALDQPCAHLEERTDGADVRRRDRVLEFSRGSVTHASVNSCIRDHHQSNRRLPEKLGLGADATKCRELPADIGASPPGATDDSVSACAPRRSPPSPARAAPAPRERLPTRGAALALAPTKAVPSINYA